MGAVCVYDCLCTRVYVCEHMLCGASPPRREPPPHAVTVQHPLFAHDAASKAQDMTVLGSVGKGTAVGEQKGGHQRRKV